MFHKKKRFPILSVIFFTSAVVLMLAAIGIGGMVYVFKPYLSDVTQEKPGEAEDRSVLAMVKTLGGFEGERTYLLLLQNDHELRPTGGFIGQYAVARVKDGELVDFFTQDAGVLDTQAPVGVQVPRAPVPLDTYLNQNFMFFRDSNWDPNMNTAAPHMVKTYALERGRYADRIDGVIAVDTYVLVALFELLGDIEVDGVSYTAENIVDTLEHQVEIAYIDKGIKKENRKDIIGVLGKELIKRAQQVSPLKYPGMLRTAQRLADEKHIIMFDYDAGVQTWYRSRGWDGTEHYDDDHVIQVIDSNLNAFKTDRVMQRAIEHVMVESEDMLEARLTLSYTHGGKERDYRTREYRSYTRVRLPANASRIQVKGAQTYDENGLEGFDVHETPQFTEVGMFFTVDLNTEESIAIEYTVPAPSQTYTVEIVKQPGTNAPRLTLHYGFDTTIAQSSLGSAKIDGTQFVFNGELREDRAFTIDFE